MPAHPKLVTNRFPDIKEGYYYYAGSAQKNLIQRLKRHARKEKSIHWHIDHLTTGTNYLKKIYVFPGADKNLECKLIDHLIENLKMTSPIKDFGNGDCTNKCYSHLVLNNRPIDQSQLFSLYQSIVCLIPSSNDIF